MRRSSNIASALAVVVALAGSAGPAAAAPAAYDVAFVSEFAAACVPGRLGYETTQAATLAAGWQEVAATSNPELGALLAAAEAAAVDPELGGSLVYKAYTKAIEGSPHYLVVSLTSAVIDDPADPWVLVGCYLYNFDAAGPIDPEPVTALIGNPIAHSIAQDGVTSHVWGPPCPMPRTGDTYLTHVAEGGGDPADLPFSGLVLKFSTSVPDPGESVPDTYC